jgi:PhnB protein
MGSDVSEACGQAEVGNNFSISIKAETEAEADELFAGLSAGAHVTMPLDKVFWGSYFGMLTDRFGINWMVSYDYQKQGNQDN